MILDDDILNRRFQPVDDAPEGKKGKDILRTDG